ncbi:MAG TPA: VOC family protein [Gemmatimonadales bacterium]|nr:VOC family protein [Gemmatimonadales bacterium]
MYERSVKPLGLMLALAACAAPEPSVTSREGAPAMSATDSTPRAAFLGLRTAKYTARNLSEARDWYARVLGIAPYFDEPFYVGFNVGGYELGLVPDTSAAAVRPEAGVAYWGVTNADSAHARLLELGAAGVEPVEDVGGGIRVATVRDPFGNLLGVIENPYFKAQEP